MSKNKIQTNIKKQAFSVMDGATKVIPTFIEKDTYKDYLNYGENNLFPQYLWDLYLRSALLQSIVNGTADYAAGDEMIFDETNPQIYHLENQANKDGELLEDVIKRVIVDYLIFGGFAMQLIYNKLGEVNEIYWLDFRNVRLNKEGDKAFYCDDWKKSNKHPIEYEVFKADRPKKGSCIYYFKGHLSRGVYPIPRYNGALSAIETSTEISKFHLNSILNNFSGNFIISFNNGAPSDDVQEKIERDIKNKFSGADNAGKFLVSFNDSKDNAVTVERIQDDEFDEKYQNLRTDTFKEIFIAFRAIPQLFGFSLEGTGFNKQEFQEAFELYNKTTVQPIQKDIKRTFNIIFGVENSVEITPFTLA